jgi:hypothetical protein
MSILIFIIISIIFLNIISIIFFATNNKEELRYFNFSGNRNQTTYQKLSNQIYSRNNVPIYYLISTLLEDIYLNNLNSLSSRKLYILKNVLDKVIVSNNQDIEPLIFDYVKRPIEIKKHNSKTINTLTDTIIDLINKYGYPIIKVKYNSILNELHEETDKQIRIVFDIKVEVFHTDSEELEKLKSYYIYIQPEYIFEKKYISDKYQFYYILNIDLILILFGRSLILYFI